MNQQTMRIGDPTMSDTGPGTRPLVSIVMPTYNRAHLVGQALEAVLGQTYSNLEIIIVNDGSRDGSREVLDEYARRDSRVRVIHKENEGIPETVNRGWRESRGKYVTWTSDDNLYHPTAIEVMVGFLESHGDVALTYTDCRHIDGDGSVIGFPAGQEPHVLENGCPIAGCLLFRREVFDKIEMFRREWTRCHDFDFYHRVYKAYPVTRIPEVLYDYRVHAESMSGNEWAIITEHARLLTSYSNSWTERRGIWGVCWAEIARQGSRQNKPWKSVWYLFRAAMHQPFRLPQFWRALWIACYGLVPGPLQHCWRSLKRNCG